MNWEERPDNQTEKYPSPNLNDSLSFYKNLCFLALSTSSYGWNWNLSAFSRRSCFSVQIHQLYRDPDAWRSLRFETTFLSTHHTSLQNPLMWQSLRSKSTSWSTFHKLLQNPFIGHSLHFDTNSLATFQKPPHNLLCGILYFLKLLLDLHFRNHHITCYVAFFTFLNRIFSTLQVPPQNPMIWHSFNI